MTIRVDVAGGGSKRLHHQRTMLLHDVDAIAPHVLLANERGGKVKVVLLGQEEGRFVVGEDVVGGERWGFKKSYVGG